MKILIAGDYCPQVRVEAFVERGDYSTLFNDIRFFTAQADYSIVNLECPICYGGEKPIEKCGPNLKCSEKGVEAVKWAGFDCITLANNHFLDYGEDGVKGTISACAKYDLDTVGGGANLQEAEKILYKRIGGKTLAIINCCEHEFSIATEATAGSNPLNPVRQYYDIKKARANADFVLVIVHGGCEHYSLPNSRMIEYYRYFIDCGADAIVNHHQHCYSGYEVYMGKPIFYGLGNFCFDGVNISNKKWNRGLLVTIDFDQDIGFEVIPYIQNEETVGVHICKKESQVYEEIINDVVSLSKIISNPTELLAAYNGFIDSTISFYRNAIEPYNSYTLKALFEKRIIPSCMNKEKKKLLYNIIACESHRERLLNSLEKAIDGIK